MKNLMRLTTSVAVLAFFIFPSLVFAATSIYSDSNGNSQFLYSNGNFSIGFGSGQGGMGGFACGSNNICQVASTFLYLINSVLVPLLFAVAFIVFLYGVFKKYILSKGDAGSIEEGHKLILWGVIGFVVMISLWGLVNVAANTFGLAGYRAPPLPTSY